MPRIDPSWLPVMADCREARTCRKPDLCRAEGVCFFVAAYERWEDRQYLSRLQRRSTPIAWMGGFDVEPGQQPALFGEAA